MLGVIMVAHRLKIVCVVLLILLVAPHMHSQAQNATLTSTPDSSVSAQPTAQVTAQTSATYTPLAIIVFTPVVSRTPLRTINAPAQLPRAMSATPAPTRQRSPTPTATVMEGLDPANQALLDNAVAAAFYSSGLRFSAKFEIAAKVDGGQGSYRYEIVGSVAHLDNPALTAFQGEFTLVNALGIVEKSSSIEMRVVNNILYFRKIDPDTGRTAPWGGITLQDMLKDQYGDLITSLTALNPMSGATDTLVATNSNTPDLTELLRVGAFIETKRVDSGSTGTAQFQTHVDLDRLLKSKETLSALLKVLSRLGGLSTSGLPSDANSIDQGVALFLLLRPLLLPSIDLFITAEVDTQQHILARVSFDLSAKVNANFNDLQKALQGTFGTVEIQGTLQLSGYGAAIVVEMPTQVTMLTTLSNIPTALTVFDLP